ncbi:MAG: NAD(P)/FAD-dependent oxidoreductase [Myxococcota bacterium]
MVIVGNGVAGLEAAMTVRAREPSWSIAVVSEESDHFFSRTALMYVLAGQLAYRDTEPLERDVYTRLRLERVRARAVSLDVAAREVVTHDGRRIPYDRLLLACGSRPRPAPWPGSEAVGVGSFVSLQDLEWLEQEVHGRSGVDRPPNADAVPSPPDSPYRRRPSAASVRGRRATRPVVIGGGLIGVETVEALLAAGLRPTFVVREESFWPIALDRTEAGFVAEALRGHGVDVRLGSNVTALGAGADGTVTRVDTEAGPIDADLVVVAIGVVPNTAWLGGVVPTDPGGGLKVDAQLRTEVPDVWAAGDCASVRWFDGKSRPEQLWYTARDQGRVAGRQLLGDDTSYARGTWYNSAKLMDIEYTTVGAVNLGLPGEQNWTFVEEGAVRSTTRLVYRDGRVLGFNFLGRRWDHTVCVRWIEERRSPAYVLDHLNEAQFDTEFVPPLRVTTRPPEA